MSHTMSRGKPDFEEAYINPRALEPAVVDFDYDAIDRRLAGEPNRENDEKIVASAFVQILAQTAASPRNPECLEIVRSRFNRLRRKVGLLGPPNRKDRWWLRSHVETDEQAERLQKALFTACLWCCSGNRSARPTSGFQTATSTTPAKYWIALTWIIAPAVFDGISLHELAKRLRIHPNTLSLYAAGMSRISGYRSHGQSKGWNFDPDKARQN